MRRPLFSPLVLLACFINGFFVSPASCEKHSSMHFELIRRQVTEVSATWTRLEHVMEIVRKDLLRAKTIAERIGRGGRRRRAQEVPFAMPMSSAAYTGIGQYFVRFRLGTPAKSFLLIADTGSDLTWVKCQRQACHRCKDSGTKRLFHAYQSSSFTPIRCSSPLCKNTLPFSVAKCPMPGSPCLYDYGYSDGSTAQGIFAKETVTITLSNQHKVKLKDIIVGCTSSSAGTSIDTADGVLGLGSSGISFATRLDGKFSYCLVDHLSPKNATGYLILGKNAIHRPDAHRSRAKLIVEKGLEPFYAVQVRGISVGGELLNVPRSVWNASEGGGVILDSGTSLTMLAEPAYGQVMAALSRSLVGYPRVKMVPFEFCFNWMAARGGFKKAAVPGLVIHLAGATGGAVRLEPPVKSYVIDVADGVKCIGILPTPWPGISTIGNILQQNHLWEFDIANRRLGFKPSSCSRKTKEEKKRRG